jgi:hypothetical protein
MSDDPERITDIDVLDPLTTRVECGAGCGTVDYVAEMRHQKFYGDYVCYSCWANEQADAEDAYRTARGW